MDPDDRERFDAIVRQIEAADPATRTIVKDELAKLTAPKPRIAGMPDGWYVIRVELLRGRDLEFRAPPGRDLLVSPQHTFRQLAEAINAAFARWDLGHLYAFTLEDGTRIGIPQLDDDDLDERDAARTKIARRTEDEVFTYEFDFGDGWMHRCTVLEAGVQPEDVYGVRPKGPVPVWGWGDIPDQYGRTTPDGGDDDEEEED
ncbi:MAG: hypothetical protein ABI635_05660 [Actinomycetota bacterium]